MNATQTAAVAFLARQNEGSPAGSAVTAEFANGGRNRAMPAWHQVRMIADGRLTAPTSPIIGRVGADEFHIG